MYATWTVDLLDHDTIGGLRAALPPEGVRFGLTLNGWLMDHDDRTPVSPEAWHTLLEVLDPAQPVGAGWLWALGEAVCEDLRTMRLSVEAPTTVEDVQAGCAESEAWWAAHSADL